MYFGERRIRSAGRKSGSVEITLPIELAVLEGVPCRLHLRDGLALEIVLRPDLQAVVPIFENLWTLLNIGLAEIGEIGDFAEADYVFGLCRVAKADRRPSLAYADALVIHRGLGAATETTPQELEAVARIIESMAAVAGGRLGLTSELADMFGNQVAYLVSGEMIGASDPFARNLVLRTASVPRDPRWCRSAPFSADNWRRAQNGLTAVYDQFGSWSRDPAAFVKERALWYRARHFDTRLRAGGG